MGSSSYTVDRLLPRTVALHGVTGPELRRFHGACHQMRRATWSQGELWWLTTPKGSTRHEIAAYQKRITREQAACGHPQYSVWIFETRPELHAHILFVGNRNVADALRRSRLCIAAKIEPVTNIEGLKKYLAKERIPQAGYKRRDLAAASAGRIACPVVAIVSVFPDSSSATPLRPAWSIHGSTRTPNDQLTAKITDHGIRATTWSGGKTHL